MQNNDSSPTTYGMRDGFDYYAYPFNSDFPIPSVYVVAYGMAHFRGPDTHLWFAPDKHPDQIRWGDAQNLAHWDRGFDAAVADDADYQRIFSSVCQLLDALIAASRDYERWTEARYGNEPPEEKPR